MACNCRKSTNAYAKVGASVTAFIVVDGAGACVLQRAGACRTFVDEAAAQYAAAGLDGDTYSIVPITI